MNRKNFLSGAAALLTIGALPAAAQRQKDIENIAGILPPYLKMGDTIGITSPAGYITLQEIQPAVTLMQSWGYAIKTGDTIGKRDFSFGGTDIERVSDFQKMLDDSNIKAIMCARGGYGSIRMIDQLNWSKFKENPKWIIGFSDITVLHAHINRTLGIATIHAKMCNSFPEVWNSAEVIQVETILSIRQALMGADIKYTVPATSFNRPGKAQGQLVGGNLKTIETLAGSRSDIRTNNKILFLEDTGEYLYSIDRMFWNLKRSGKLSQLKGLILGGFKMKADDPGEEFGRTLYDIVMEKVKEYQYPVCFNFPVGHQKNNFALKCGVEHLLDVNSNGCTLRALN